MRTIEKRKKKLKRWKWLNKHLGTIILTIYFPLLIANYILLTFVPFLAVGLLCTAFLSVVIGGCIKLGYADDENVRVTLEQEINAMETANESELEVLDRTIHKYEQNPTLFKDKKSTKRLIKELIKVRKSVEIALEEQKEEDLGL